MARVIQVRNVPDEVHRELRKRAAEAGVALSDYVLDELRRIALRSSNAEVLIRAAMRPGGAPHGDPRRARPRPCRSVIVVDAAAVLDVLIGSDTDPALRVRLVEQDLHAPHLIDVEVLHSLRVLGSRAVAAQDRIEAACADFGALELTRYPHVGLRGRIWELRHNLPAYDATYVALAEGLGVPLVTTDARIGRAPGLRVSVEVFGRSSHGG